MPSGHGKSDYGFYNGSNRLSEAFLKRFSDLKRAVKSGANTLHNMVLDRDLNRINVPLRTVLDRDLNRAKNVQIGYRSRFKAISNVFKSRCKLWV